MTNKFTDMNSLLTVHFRNSVTDPVSGRGSDESDDFTGDGTTKDFVLSVPAVSNVILVTVDGDEVYYIKGYTMDISWSNKLCTISLVRAPKSGAAIHVDYHVQQHFVFPGWVKMDISPTLPRVGFVQMPGKREEVGIGQVANVIKEDDSYTFTADGSTKTFNFPAASTPVEYVESVYVDHATPLYEVSEYTFSRESITFREAPPGDGVTPNLEVAWVYGKDKGLRKAVRYVLYYQISVWAQNPRYRDDIASQLCEAIDNPANRKRLRKMGFDAIVSETPADLPVEDNAKVYRKDFEIQVTIETTYDELYNKIQEVVINPITVGY